MSNFSQWFQENEGIVGRAASFADSQRMNAQPVPMGQATDAGMAPSDSPRSFRPDGGTSLGTIASLIGAIYTGGATAAVGAGVAAAKDRENA